MTAPLTSANMMEPAANAAEQSRMELQAKLNGLGGLNGRQLSPEAKEKKLREACEGFESIFIQKMWQEMRNAVPKTGLLTGREERYWQDMYDQELSKSMTKAGGIGLSDMMYEQLSRNLVSASRSAAGSAMGGAFVPGAAPLLAENDATDFLAPPAAASIYESAAPETAPAAPDMQAADSKTEEAPVAQAPAAPAAQPAAMPPLTAQNVKAAAQPQQADASSLYVAAPNTSHASQPKSHAADLGQNSGMMNAQRAHREAGDKLGSRSVRPSTRRKAAMETAPEAPQAPAAQSGILQAGSMQPGSPEALRAAVAISKSGAASEPISEPVDLNTLLANVQARNAQAFDQPQAAADAAPVVRKVRRTTNIPQRANNKNNAPQTQGQAIRTLNVDNVGVNSKAGQGLKAYHAQQAAMNEIMSSQPATQPLKAASQPAQPIAPLAASAAQADAVIPPLTPQNAAMSADNSGNFAIPPLTAANTRR